MQDCTCGASTKRSKVTYMRTNHLDTDGGDTLPQSYHQLNLQASSVSAAAMPVRYEEREIPGKGIGLFATAQIQSGTRVLSEDPLIVLPDEANTIVLYEHIQSLNAEGQRQFWGLAAVIEPENTGDWTAKLHSRNGGGQDELASLVREHERAASIYETNRFTVRSSDYSTDKVGIFPKAARLNHSCAPNVFHRFNTMTGTLTVHALRNIEPDEELLTSYIDICHNTTKRRQLLRHWAFHCECDACNSSNHDQDCRRAYLEEVLHSIKMFELRRADEGWFARDYAESLPIVEATINTMEAESMYESDTLGEMYSRAAEYAAFIDGLHGQAVEWGENAVAIELKCCGRDSSEYIRAAAFVKSLRND